MTVLERILVTVRTYPTPSASYRETVCTGGVTEQGAWRRLYPVPLRYLNDEQQFKTWDVIRLHVRPATRDKRPESRRPHLPTLRIVDSLVGWPARVQWLKDTIAPSLNAMVMSDRTIGPVAVSQVLDLTVKKANVEWDAGRKRKLEALCLFDEPLPLEKIPFEFRFIWRDRDGEQHDSLVISWELAQTWRTYSQKYDNPVKMMTDKLLDDYFSASRDVAFFMGNHSRFRNTFMVCGWFIPPRTETGHETLW